MKSPINKIFDEIDDLFLSLFRNPLTVSILIYIFSDTQTILTIQNHVITKNHRISILHSEHKTWQLKIKDIRESDRGFYMCQMNTDPMKSQTGYLDVVGKSFFYFS